MEEIVISSIFFGFSRPVFITEWQQINVSVTRKMKSKGEIEEQKKITDEQILIFSAFMK